MRRSHRRRRQPIIYRIAEALDRLMPPPITGWRVIDGLVYAAPLFGMIATLDVIGRLLGTAP